jgi:UDP-N-acetylglucosamine 4,6-dehydratase
MENFKNHLPDLTNSSILITGGTGSFGKAMLKELFANHNPRRVAVYSRDEFKQYQMEENLSSSEKQIFRSFIGDVRDKDRLSMALTGVDYVFHAAALKQVPTAEYNPFECIRTNVIGAENVVQASIRAGVKKVIALSTDKAANPVNLYGASKLAADKIFIAGNSFGHKSGTSFAVVRYGNVVGSRGSIIPFFKRLVAEGKKTLPITDVRMTRFWITIPQAVNFTLSSLEIMRGGEIFVPKIPSMNVLDLAEAVAPGMDHEIIGIRPGEKIHEIMIDEHGARSTIDYGDRYIIEPEWVFWKRKSFLEDGYSQPDEGFEYSSGTNEQWLDVAGMQDMIKDLSDE